MIVLDTHAFVWFADDPGSLSRKSRSLIESNMETGSIFVSSISAWEIMVLSQKGRLEFAVPAEVWIERCEKTGVFNFVPVDNTIARISVTLGLHSDPADRFIAATAVYLGAILITKDRKLRQSKAVPTLW